MREPDLVGEFGKAWKVASKSPAQIVNYIVQTTGQQTNEDWWLMTAVSLTPMPGFPIPHKRFPSAAYELLFVALESKSAEDPIDPDDEKTIHFVMPIDVTHQYGNVGNNTISDLIELSIQKVIQGKMRAPCSENFEYWITSLDQMMANLLAAKGLIVRQGKT